MWVAQSRRICVTLSCQPASARGRIKRADGVTRGPVILPSCTEQPPPRPPPHMHAPAAGAAMAATVTHAAALRPSVVERSPLPLPGPVRSRAAEAKGQEGSALCCSTQASLSLGGCSPSWVGCARSGWYRTSPGIFATSLLRGAWCLWCDRVAEVAPRKRCIILTCNVPVPPRHCLKHSHTWGVFAEFALLKDISSCCVEDRGSRILVADKGSCGADRRPASLPGCRPTRD